MVWKIQEEKKWKTKIDGNIFLVHKLFSNDQIISFLNFLYLFPYVFILNFQPTLSNAGRFLSFIQINSKRTYFKYLKINSCLAITHFIILTHYEKKIRAEKICVFHCKY